MSKLHLQSKGLAGCKPPMRLFVLLAVLFLTTSSIATAQSRDTSFSLTAGESPIIDLTDVAEKECSARMTEKFGNTVIDLHYQPKNENAALLIFANLKEIYREINAIVEPLSTTGVHFYLLGIKDPPKSYKIAVPKQDELLVDSIVFDLEEPINFDCLEDKLGLCRRLFQVRAHEAVHPLLDKLIDHEKTRWFDDGLAEYVGDIVLKKFHPELTYKSKNISMQAALNQHRIRERLFDWKNMTLSDVKHLRRAENRMRFETQKYDAAQQLVRSMIDTSKKKGIENPLSVLVQRMTELAKKKNKPLNGDDLNTLIHDYLKVDIEKVGILDVETQQSLVSEATALLSNSKVPIAPQDKFYAVSVLANLDRMPLTNKWIVFLFETAYNKNEDDYIRVMAATAISRRSDSNALETAFEQLQKSDPVFRDFTFKKALKDIKERSIDASMR
ncbi:MAG TPA: hypothetical protein PKC89_12715 [Pyrinomonadaceae bacterium]|nr:hypothetical protein [Pyrinomonadaceae bacterium]